MTTVTIHEAKTHLSRLIRDVLAGREVTIAQGRSGEELVKLVPAVPLSSKRRTPNRFAHLRGEKGVLDHGFWKPLSDEELSLWNAEDGPE